MKRTDTDRPVGLTRRLHSKLAPAPALFAHAVVTIAVSSAYTIPATSHACICVAAETGIDTSLSGSTAVVCLLRGEDVHCINVGDSRAVLGANIKGKLQPVQMSIDHKPDLPAEKARILATGGRVLATKNKYANSFAVWMCVVLSDAVCFHLSPRDLRGLSRSN